MPKFDGIDLPKKPDPPASQFNPFLDDEEDKDDFGDFETAATPAPADKFAKFTPTEK